MYKSLNQYRFLLWTWLSFLGLNLLSRLILLITYDDTLNQESLVSLLYGIRMDTIVFCAFALIFSLLYAFNLRWLLRMNLTVFAVSVVFLEISTWLFYAQFASRPNYLFIEHARNSPELIGTVWGLYPFAFIATAIVLIALIFLIFHLSKKVTISPNIMQRWLIYPLLVFVLFLGMRSSLDDSTPNPSFYTFSQNHVKNEIANNSMFSILFAWHWASKEYFGNYGELTEQEIFNHIREQNNFASEHQLLRLQTSIFQGKKNVILIMLESFGADHVGYLGGTSTTPQLDALAASGMAFTNMFATGTRTSWGVSSVLTALYPLPNREYVKALKSQQNFYTIAQSFKRHGYQNTFLYAGDADFDNMRGFMLNNGYDHVLGKEAFSSSLQKQTWGYSDEDLYAKALQRIEQQSNESSPFFLTLLTLSSHEPFDYPSGKTPLYANAKPQSFANSIKYADFALGSFYQTLKEKGLLENTIVAFIADHANAPYGAADVPIDRFHIAAVIMDDDVKTKHYAAISSQVDFGPTLLDLAGLDVWLPSIGNSVLQNKRNNALLRYNQNFAFINQDGFIVYKDAATPQAYHLDYTPRPTNNSEIKNGLANILAPHLLYETEAYHLQDKQ